MFVFGFSCSCRFSLSEVSTTRRYFAQATSSRITRPCGGMTRFLSYLVYIYIICAGLWADVCVKDQYADTTGCRDRRVQFDVGFLMTGYNLARLLLHNVETKTNILESWREKRVVASDVGCFTGEAESPGGASWRHQSHMKCRSIHHNLLRLGEGGCVRWYELQHLLHTLVNSNANNERPRLPCVLRPAHLAQRWKHIGLLRLASNLVYFSCCTVVSVVVGGGGGDGGLGWW